MKMSVASNEAGGVKVERGNTEKVTVGGKEYYRTKLTFESQGSKAEAYYYMRKLDDDLSLEFDIGGRLNMPIEDYEKLFE